jgi:protein-L-isoaspartate(D-aspartate) O-methyltransferase
MGYFPQAKPLAKGIHDPAVRHAFTHTDRSRFVSAQFKTSAWSDQPLPIEDRATISQPSLVAKMTEWLALKRESRVLEIGTGSGYQTALLAQLADHVYTIDISKPLSQHARLRLEALGYRGIHFRISDGALGWPEAAPFDRIIATVAFPNRPTRLIEQLADHGICLVPVGLPSAEQRLIQYQRDSTKITARVRCKVRFLSLQ